MELTAVNYAIHRPDRKPRLLIVTDIDQTRLDRAELLYGPKEAARNGISAFEAKGQIDPVYAELHNLCAANKPEKQKHAKRYTC
jgi:hypothetical protein